MNVPVMFFKSIKPPKGDKPAPKPGADKPGIQGDDVNDDKPAHEHLRELADVLEQRQDGGGAPEGGEGGAEGGEGGEGAPGAGDEGGSEFNAENVNQGDFVAFTAGDFTGSGKVSAVGDDGVTVTDKSGRDHRVHWAEVTAAHPADAPGDTDPGDTDGAPDAPGAEDPPQPGDKPKPKAPAKPKGQK